MGVVLHRAPHEVGAPHAALDAGGALRGGDLVEIAEDDRERDADVPEVGLVIVPGAVALHLVVADPARELLDHAARLLLAALAEEPAELVGGDAGRIEQRAHVPRDALEALEVLFRREPGEEPEERIHRDVAEADAARKLALASEEIGGTPHAADLAEQACGPMASRFHTARGGAEGVDERSEDGWAEEGSGAHEQEPAADVARRADGDEAHEIVVASGVAVAEHPAHGIPQVDDLGAAGALLPRAHRRWKVFQQVAVEIPGVVEVRGRIAAPCRRLTLQIQARSAMPAQLDDVAVGAEIEQALDEARAGEGVAVLRPAGEEGGWVAPGRVGGRARARGGYGGVQGPPPPGGGGGGFPLW